MMYKNGVIATKIIPVEDMSKVIPTVRAAFIVYPKEVYGTVCNVFGVDSDGGPFIEITIYARNQFEIENPSLLAKLN